LCAAAESKYRLPRSAAVAASSRADRGSAGDWWNAPRKLIHVL